MGRLKMGNALPYKMALWGELDIVVSLHAHAAESGQAAVCVGQIGTVQEVFQQPATPIY